MGKEGRKNLRKNQVLHQRNGSIGNESGKGRVFAFRRRYVDSNLCRCAAEMTTLEYSLLHVVTFISGKVVEPNKLLKKAGFQKNKFKNFLFYNVLIHFTKEFFFSVAGFCYSPSSQRTNKKWSLFNENAKYSIRFLLTRSYSTINSDRGPCLRKWCFRRKI